jgi:hypothetical protein
MQQRRPQPGKRKHSARLVMGAAGLILTALIIVGVSNYLHERFRDARFDRFISQVRRSDDVLITDYGKRDDGKYFVAGFATGSMPVLPVGDFGLKPDDVEVRLINHVFAVDHSNSGLQLQAFRDHLDQINGTPWPTIDSPAGQAWIESTTDHIANAYLQGRALGRAFIVVIEHPRRLKPAADQLSGRIAWRLYREGIYEPHLVRTLAVDAAPPVIRVLEERTVGK